MKLYLRNVKLSIFKSQPDANLIADNPAFFDREPDGVVITGLRVTYKVERSLSQEPNTCEIVVFNLSEQTRRLCAHKPAQAILEAGYDGENRLVFRGDINYSNSEQKGPNWETKLILGDGGRAYSQARVNRSYASGTPVIVALRDAARSMGLALPRNVEADPTLRQQFNAGRVMFGDTSAQLAKLLAPYGYKFSIQDGRLQILRDEEIHPGEAHEIGPSNGLIESPELGQPTKDGKPPKLTVRCILFPELFPGGLLSINSRSINGVYRMDKVRHDGDSTTGDNRTEIEVSPPSTPIKVKKGKK